MNKTLTKRVPLLLSLSALSIVLGNLSAVAEPAKLADTNSQEMFRDTPTPAQPNFIHTTPQSFTPAETTKATVTSPAITPTTFNSSTTQTIEEVAVYPQLSTSAADLTPKASEDQQLQAGVPNNTTYEIAQIRRNPSRIPGSNFVGVGFSFGAGRDSVDFTVFSKFKLLEFPTNDPVASLSIRPSVGFGSQLDIRVPVTVEPRMAVFDVNDPVERFSPFAGLGAAITVDDGEADFNFMLTGGADYLLTRQLTLTGMANLLFFSDVQLEGQVGIGYNF